MKARDGWIPLESGLTELTEEEGAQYDFTPEERERLEARLRDIDACQLNNTRQRDIRR